MDEGARKRECEGGGGRRLSGDLPVVVELFDPVHDEPQAQARGANGEELRLLVFIDREEL